MSKRVKRLFLNTGSFETRVDKCGVKHAKGHFLYLMSLSSHHRLAQQHLTERPELTAVSQLVSITRHIRPSRPRTSPVISSTSGKTSPTVK